MFPVPFIFVTRILRARGGSSPIVERIGSQWEVFSAHAEVVPKISQSITPPRGILRARGGSS